MAAHVEECVDSIGLVTRDDDALVADGSREVIASVRNLIRTAGTDPAVEIKAVEFAAVELGIRIESPRKRLVHPPAIIQPGPQLRRALGRWDLTAIGVNQVIGGAIF